MHEYKIVRIERRKKLKFHLFTNQKANNFQSSALGLQINQTFISIQI